MVIGLRVCVIFFPVAMHGLFFERVCEYRGNTNVMPCETKRRGPIKVLSHGYWVKNVCYFLSRCNAWVFLLVSIVYGQDNLICVDEHDDLFDSYFKYTSRMPVRCHGHFKNHSGSS